MDPGFKQRYEWHNHDMESSSIMNDDKKSTFKNLNLSWFSKLNTFPFLNWTNFRHGNLFMLKRRHISTQQITQHAPRAISVLTSVNYSEIKFVIMHCTYSLCKVLNKIKCIMNKLCFPACSSTSNILEPVQLNANKMCLHIQIMAEFTQQKSVLYLLSPGI